MADVIEVDFRKKRKIEKYTVIKNVCTICYNLVIYDSRKGDDNEPYIELERKRGECVCKQCAVAIKEVVDENEWN